MATTRLEYTPAANVPCKVEGEVKAGTLVEIAAAADGRNPVVKTATADAYVFGVAAFDGKADEYITVYRTGIYEVAANGSIAAGAKLHAAANGQVKADGAGPIAGVAIAAKSGSSVLAALN